MSFTCGENNERSRRKLNLKKSAYQSDLSKAVVLYQPFPGKRILGRNLVPTDTSVESNQPSVSNTQEAKSHNSVSHQPSYKSTKQLSYLYRLLLGSTFVITVILMSSSKVQESSASNSTMINLKLLQNHLNTHLFGQAPAIETIVDVLKELHVTVEQLAVLILFGGSGTGKTWTTHLVENVVSKESNIKYLHLGPWLSQADIRRVFSSVQCFHWNFFFIEDADYASHEELEFLIDQALIASRNTSCPHQKTVIIFTSNYGQKELAEVLLKEYEHSKTRQTLSYPLIYETTNEINSPVTDALSRREITFVRVPYLPLEKTQLEQCIQKDLMMKKIIASSELVNKIVDGFRFLPPNKNYFVSTGCKTVPTKVSLNL